RGLPGKGRSLGGAGDTVATATRPYWPQRIQRPGTAAGRCLVGRAGGMDSLFVEEVAASLVREFLSRKVRFASSTTLGRFLVWGTGRCDLGVPRPPPHLPGGRLSPCRLPAREMTRPKRHFPGMGNYISQEPFLPESTSREELQDPGRGPRAPLLGSGRGLQRGRALSYGPSPSFLSTAEFAQRSSRPQSRPGWPSEHGVPSPQAELLGAIASSSGHALTTVAPVNSDSDLCSQGLKKTCVTMDQERPRSDLSINSRNDLRKVLHLEFLYKENKVQALKVCPGVLEQTLAMVAHSLGPVGPPGTGGRSLALTVVGEQQTQPSSANPQGRVRSPAAALWPPQARNPKAQPLAASLHRTLVAGNAEFARGLYLLLQGPAERPDPRISPDNLDGDVLGNFVSSKRHPHKSKPVQSVLGESPTLAPAWEKVDKLQSSEPSSDTKKMGEKIRPKSGLIVRGIMAGPTASSPQASLRKRSLRRSCALSSITPAHEEESRKVPELSTGTQACPAPQEGLALSNGSSPQSPLGLHSELSSDKQRNSPGSPPHLPRRGLLHRERGWWREPSEESPAANGAPEANRTPLNFYLPGGNARSTQERLERAFKRQGSQPPPLRTVQAFLSLGSQSKPGRGEEELM
ncbi:putative ubiquitin carboxyl-terminal hydrolase MINDY-4, partial [Galemys pyrenaicus]